MASLENGERPVTNAASSIREGIFKSVMLGRVPQVEAGFD